MSMCSILILFNRLMQNTVCLLGFFIYNIAQARKDCMENNSEHQFISLVMNIWFDICQDFDLAILTAEYAII